MPVISPTVPNCSPCACTPYTNTCCCPPQNGISVMQPKCQILPTGFCGEAQMVSNNPCFCQSNNTSFWTFKFFTDCAEGTTNAISHFVIPICNTITLEQVDVFIKVDTCGSFTQVPTEAIDIKNSLQQHGTAPQFFNWLKVDNTGLFSKGVCVTYLIAIKGNFQIATGPVEVFAGETNNIFNCQPNTCFQVPGCIPAGNLSIRKTCTEVVNDANNTATITYTATITNNGPSPVTNLQFTDTQTVPAGSNIVSVTNIVPNTLTAAILGSTVTVSGPINITLNPGQSTNVSYNLTVGFAAPGIFNFTNNASVVGISNGIQVTSNTAHVTCTVNVVQVRAEKSCNVTNGNQVSFRIRISTVGQSPATTVNITDILTIPAGLTIHFPANAFGGCTAVFVDNNTPVPTGVNITFTASRQIRIVCSGVAVPAGGFVDRFITFTVVSTSVSNCNESISIVNRVTEVTPVVTGNTISLNTLGLPATAIVNVLACIICANACATV